MVLTNLCMNFFSEACAQLCAIERRNGGVSCPFVSLRETLVRRQTLASQGTRRNSLKKVSGGKRLANRCLRPLGHLSTDLSCVWSPRSCATQVDDRRMTRNRGVILPQALWEVQAIREVDYEKLSGEVGKGSQV
jgi:hypothetical protein